MEDSSVNKGIGMMPRSQFDHQLDNRQADRRHDSAECAGESGQGNQMTVIGGQSSGSARNRRKTNE
jgi:hypothetical protein